jgi:exopolysaccharide biosynthesis polyprenyl glycosylphosphotransferase
MGFMDINIGKSIRRNWRTYIIGLDIVSDIISLFLATAITVYIRKNLSYVLSVPVSFLWKLGICFNITIICIAMLVGVYRSVLHNNLSQQYLLLCKAYIFTIFFIFFLALIAFGNYFPKKFTLLYLVIVPIFPFFARLILYQFNTMMQKKGYGIYKSLVIGDEASWMRMLERCRIFPELGYKVVGLIVWGRDAQQNDALNSYDNLPVYPFSSLRNILESCNIERVFLSTSRILDQDDGEIFAACQEHKIKLKVVTQEAEDMLRFSFIRDISGLPLYAPERKKIETVKRIIKRLFDIIFSVAAILLLLPFILFIAALIYAEDRGAIIYKQKRALAKGRNEFYFYKFRSMKTGADEIQQEFYKYNEASGGLFRMEKDPRVTKIGKIIRKYSIDELLQLFNVLKGDMSIVGPRPLSLADLDNITSANSMRGYYALRANAKPGITGLWQISGRREVHFREMVLLDLYYIENQSLLFDLEIILETIPVVLFGKGAY